MGKNIQERKAYRYITIIHEKPKKNHNRMSYL